MKTVLSVTLILVCSLQWSCNKDDDNTPNVPQQAYFPTQISTVYTGSSSAINMHIHYDANNSISKFDFVNGSDTNTYDTTHNSDGMITSIMHTRPDGSTLEYAFGYSNGRVSQLTLINSSSSVPFAVVYNEFTNTYSVPTGSGDLIFKYDASGNVIDINTGSGSVSFSYNSNEGVYKNIPDNFPLVLVMSLGSTSSNLFNSLLFCTQQLSGMMIFSNTVNIEATRNEDNQIETTKFIDATSFEIQSTATIIYELR